MPAEPEPALCNCTSTSMDSHIAANDDGNNNELNINDTHASVDQSSVAQVEFATPPPSIVSAPTMSSTAADSQTQHADVDMDDLEYHDMPGLQNVSDSSDSEDDDSDVDAREVEM